MIQALVLDLDDTIYLERDYVRSGFRSLAAQLAPDGQAMESELFEFLWSGFEEGVRGTAFDRLLESFPSLKDEMAVDLLVETYRNHDPQITPAEPAALETLFESELPVFLITDGPPVGQGKKLAALGLSEVFTEVFMTDRWGVEFRKPHHRAFEEVERASGLSGGGLAYVADNPAKDFIAPNERGWLSVRLRMPGQLHERAEPESAPATPALEVSSLARVQDLLGDQI